jgi:hypothetical protein
MVGHVDAAGGDDGAGALRRRDNAQRFTAAECARGAAGGMLLERLLPELAYKMGRASKYGA